MAKFCPITGATSRMAGGYSNSVRATKYNPTGSVRKYPNLQKKKIFVPELGGNVKMEISARGLRTIKKLGAFAALRKVGLLK